MTWNHWISECVLDLIFGTDNVTTLLEEKGGHREKIVQWERSKDMR